MASGKTDAFFRPVENYERIEIMNHYDVLNAMLAENCPTDKSEDGLINDFEFEGCCVSFRIKAELISTVNTIQYKILEFEIL